MSSLLALSLLFVCFCGVATDDPHLYSLLQKGKKEVGAALTHTYSKECLSVGYVPFPTSISCGNANSSLIDPCNIVFVVEAAHTVEHLEELIQSLMGRAFNCNEEIEIKYGGVLQSDNTYRVRVESDNYSLKTPLWIKEEAYYFILD